MHVKFPQTAKLINTQSLFADLPVLCHGRGQFQYIRQGGDQGKILFLKVEWTNPKFQMSFVIE